MFCGWKTVARDEKMNLIFFFSYLGYSHRQANTTLLLVGEVFCYLGLLFICHRLAAAPHWHLWALDQTFSVSASVHL